MMRKFLLTIQKLTDVLLGESPGEDTRQQNITVVGNNNIVIVNGNKPNPNLILPKHQNKVKHFPSQNLVEAEKLKIGGENRQPPDQERGSGA